MKIVQLTDLHIPSEGEDTHGVDVLQNFQDIINTVRELSPDLVVVSGDVCLQKGDAAIYQWVRSHLDFLRIPYTAIGGNHDDPVLLANAFQIGHLLKGNELYYARELNGQPVFFLETSYGFVSENQLAWLHEELSVLEKDAVIFMHHPPLSGGVPFMDNNHALRNMDEVQAILFNFPHHLTIFCGHYHVDKTICKKNLTVHITPSTYFQIDGKAEGFKVDHYRIVCRDINLRSDGAVDSMVIYRDGNKI